MENSRPSARRQDRTSSSCSGERPGRHSPPTIRFASRLSETGWPVRASKTTTPTGEVSTRASRSARARCSARCRRALAIAAPACDANQRQDLLVLPGERLPALLVGQIEVAHLHAPVSDRRPQEAPRQRRVSRKPQRAEVGRQVPEPERAAESRAGTPTGAARGAGAGTAGIPRDSRRRVTKSCRCPDAVHGRDPAAAGAGPARGRSPPVPSINSSCMRLANFLQPECFGRLHVGRFKSRRRLYSGVEV